MALETVAPRYAPTLSVRACIGAAASAALAAVLLIAGWTAAHQLTLVTPGPYSHGRLLAARPADFPVVENARVIDATAGERLAYQITYAAAADPVSVRSALLQAPSWYESASSSPEELELLRHTETGAINYIARFRIEPAASGSLVVVEFSPIPVGIAPVASK